jgi:hypothetical protein
MATKSNGHGMSVEKGSTGFRTTVIAKLFEYFNDKGKGEEHPGILQAGNGHHRHEARHQLPLRQYESLTLTPSPDMDFHDVKVVRETPNVVVAEYALTTPSSKTGRVIHQLFVGCLEAKEGQIKLLHESINLVELGLAIYTNGMADYKVPDNRK